MKFQDVEHSEKYKELLEKTKARNSESEYQAAIYLLSSPLLVRRCAKYVKQRGISLNELIELSRPWASSEKALVKLAAALFNSSWKVDVNDVFWSLDAGSTKLALEALKIRFS